MSSPRGGAWEGDYNSQHAPRHTPRQTTPRSGRIPDGARSGSLSVINFIIHLIKTYQYILLTESCVSQPRHESFRVFFDADSKPPRVLRGVLGMDAPAPWATRHNTQQLAPSRGGSSRPGPEWEARARLPGSPRCSCSGVTPAGAESTWSRLWGRVSF